jgi:hypothetical protein
MFTDEERKFANEATPNFNRGQHLREAFAVLGLLPIIGFLFANHSWVFILVFLLFVNGIAFGLRFLTHQIPTWAFCLISMGVVFSIGYAYLWLT